MQINRNSGACTEYGTKEPTSRYVFPYKAFLGFKLDDKSPQLTQRAVLERIERYLLLVRMFLWNRRFSVYDLVKTWRSSGEWSDRGVKSTLKHAKCVESLRNATELVRRFCKIEGRLHFQKENSCCLYTGSHLYQTSTISAPFFRHTVCFL